MHELDFSLIESEGNDLLLSEPLQQPMQNPVRFVVGDPQVRFVGLALLLAAGVYAFWIAPQAWTSVAVYAALAFYLLARGAGAFSIDGAVAATVR